MRISEILRPLHEGMAPLDGLAVNVSEFASERIRVVVYDPSKANARNPNAGVVAACVLMRFNDEFWITSSVKAVNGYGPTVYAIMADLCAAHGALLMQSANTSPAAKRLWTKFEHNPHVEVVPVADRMALNGNSYNPTPTGFALRGRGTIGLEAAQERDRETAERLGKAWHAAMIDGALSRLKSAMDAIYSG